MDHRFRVLTDVADWDPRSAIAALNELDADNRSERSAEAARVLALMAAIPAPACGECGAAIADVERHTSWHAGAGQDDARAVILGFLDSIDPAQLSQAALNVDDVDDPIVAALTILKQAAASLP